MRYVRYLAAEYGYDKDKIGIMGFSAGGHLAGSVGTFKGDFEYELQMSQMNRKLEENIETVFLTTNLEYSYLSSSMVKEVAAFGGDISQLVPALVADEVNEKMKEKRRV